jgi:hypothetical protein
MNMEASLVQLDKPLSGKPLLADHYSELGGNTLSTGLNWLRAVPVVVSSVKCLCSVIGDLINQAVSSSTSYTI